MNFWFWKASTNQFAFQMSQFLLHKCEIVQPSLEGGCSKMFVGDVWHAS